MRDHSHHISLTREDAVSAMIAKIRDLDLVKPQYEQVPVVEAFGRVLAEDVLSLVDKPNALTCNMDSIGLHWADFEAAAAQDGEGAIPDTTNWVRGVDWQFANTGVAMPIGFDTAIAIENAEVSADEQHVRLLKAPSGFGAGTHEAGSKGKVGDLLASAGTLITPDVAARIASGNICSVTVVRKPRVVFIPTGNELVCPGGFLERGRNIETNSIVVKGKAEAWGADFSALDIVPDKPELIEAAILKATRMGDIVVLNAGSSKGSDDWSVEQMEKLGDVICQETNHGPGHHSSYAIVDGTPIVGISGPSGGASFTLNFYLKPLIRLYLGLDTADDKIPAVLTQDIPAKPRPPRAGTPAQKGEDRGDVVKPKMQFFGIRMMDVQQGADGVLRATPVNGHAGSPATDGANAFAMINTSAEPPKAGDVIMIEYR